MGCARRSVASLHQIPYLGDGACHRAVQNNRDQADDDLRNPNAMSQTRSIVSAQSAQIAPLFDSFKSYRSFQTQQVLEKIVAREKQRIQGEKFAWRLAGAAAGLLLGSADGLNFNDLFTAFTFGNLAGLAHAKFSKQDIQFLNEISTYWVVADGSPIDIMKRLGAPRSRILMLAEDNILVFTHHAGPRGEFLIPLGSAALVCPGFTNARSREVLERSFEREDVEILSDQLYPSLDGALQLDSVRRVSEQEALERHPVLSTVAVEKGYQPIDLEIGGEKTLAFRIPVPLHSDF